jgi:hypothetical protein
VPTHIINIPKYKYSEFISCPENEFKSKKYAIKLLITPTEIPMIMLNTLFKIHHLFYDFIFIICINFNKYASHLTIIIQLIISS